MLISYTENHFPTEYVPVRTLFFIHFSESYGSIDGV